MSFPDPPLSRRAVMQSAGLAPIILLARETWAEPTDENMRRLAEATAQVPEEQLKTIVASAKSQHQVDGRKYELVARAMWSHFRFGAGNVEVPDTEGIMEFAYEYKTGAKVAENLKRDYFDPLGNHYLTNICAYLCGHKAATIAINGVEDMRCAGRRIERKTPPRIDKTIYECAWLETEKEVKQKLAAARSLGNPALPADPLTGGGC